MAVAEDRGGAVEQRGLRISAGRHHRGFDVDVRIDKARRDDAAGGVVDGDAVPDFPRGTLRFHRRDAAPCDPDLAAGVDAFGVSRKHPGAGDDKIGGEAARCNVGETAGHRVQGRDRKTGQSCHVATRCWDDWFPPMLALRAGRSKFKYGGWPAYPLGRKRTFPRFRRLDQSSCAGGITPPSTSVSSAATSRTMPPRTGSLSSVIRLVIPDTEIAAKGSLQSL